MKVATTAVASLLLSSSSIFASIILTVDSLTLTITASGSVTGITDDFYGATGGIGWGIGGGIYDVSSLFSDSGPAAPFAATGQTFGSDWLLEWDQGLALSEVTISATGNSIDYSGWAPADRAALEGTIGQTLGVFYGTPSSTISIAGSISPIPEPGLFGPMIAVVSGVLVTTRRRSKV